MAERRMFTKKITESDAFLDMPSSTQMLYFHLSMNADDDGFVNNPKKIQRMCGASNDDFKLLIAKSFVILFESGVIVIKHWKMHNYIQSDRYKPTDYIEEKSMLGLKQNKAYTLDEEQMVAPCLPDKYLSDNEPSDCVQKKTKKPYYPNDELLDEAFNEYVTMRKRIKKPICTGKALHRAMNTLDKLSGGDNDLAVKILNQSVDHCWQGLFALKEDDSNKKGNQDFNKGSINWDGV